MIISMDKIIKFAKSYAFWTVVFGFWGWFFANVDSCSQQPKHVNHVSYVEQKKVDNNDDGLEKTIKEANELKNIADGDYDL